MCQSDVLLSQEGFTQTIATENHTDTIECTAPWNYNFKPNREYWKFNSLQKNKNYVLQVERIAENKSECTVFTSPSMFVGGYGKLVKTSGSIVELTYACMYVHYVWSNEYVDEGKSVYIQY